MFSQQGARFNLLQQQNAIYSFYEFHFSTARFLTFYMDQNKSNKKSTSTFLIRVSISLCKVVSLL